MDIFELIIAVVTAGGGGALITFLGIRSFGDAWLNSKFEEKLEAFRHDRAKELERFKFEIDSAFKARDRIQEKQFEGCMSIWASLKDAQSKLLVSINMLQQYPNIRWMTDHKREEFLQEFDFPKSTLDEILSSDDPQAVFTKIISRQRFIEAAEEFSKFDRVTRTYELFFDQTTFGLIRDVTDAMHEVMLDKEMYLDGHKESGRAAWTQYQYKCVPAIKALVSKFQEILKIESL